MFDVGFSELVLLLVIGLLVLGPERLPRVARTLGAYVRKARNAWTQVKYDIDRELEASEMRRNWRESMEEARKDLEAVRGQVDAEIKTVDDQVKTVGEEVRHLDQATRNEAQQLNRQSHSPGGTAPGTGVPASRPPSAAAVEDTAPPSRERSDEQT